MNGMSAGANGASTAVAVATPTAFKVVKAAIAPSQLPFSSCFSASVDARTTAEFVLDSNSFCNGLAFPRASFHFITSASSESVKWVGVLSLAWLLSSFQRKWSHATRSDLDFPPATATTAALYALKQHCHLSTSTGSQPNRSCASLLPGRRVIGLSYPRSILRISVCSALWSILFLPFSSFFKFPQCTILIPYHLLTRLQPLQTPADKALAPTFAWVRAFPSSSTPSCRCAGGDQQTSTSLPESKFGDGIRHVHSEKQPQNSIARTCPHCPTIHTQIVGSKQHGVEYHAPWRPTKCP
jgi:hypothetical protein